MWDLKKTLAHVAGVKARIAQGKPAFHATPEEKAYFDARERLAGRGASDASIEASTARLKERAFPLNDWPPT